MSNKRKLKAPRQKKSPTQAETGQLQVALMNLRQMYDQKVMEVEAFKAQVRSRDQLLAALVASAKKKVLVATQAALEDVQAGAYAGLDVQTEDGSENVRITLIKAEIAEEEEEDGAE